MVIAVIVLVLIGWGIVSIVSKKQNKKFDEQGAETEGTIVRIKSELFDDSTEEDDVWEKKEHQHYEIKYYVEYMSKTGSKESGKFSVRSQTDVPQYQVGQRIKIRYIPGNPGAGIRAID